MTYDVDEKKVNTDLGVGALARISLEVRRMLIAPPTESYSSGQHRRTSLPEPRIPRVRKQCA